MRRKVIRESYQIEGSKINHNLFIFEMFLKTKTKTKLSNYFKLLLVIDQKVAINQMWTFAFLFSKK